MKLRFVLLGLVLYSILGQSCKSASKTQRDATVSTTKDSSEKITERVFFGNKGGFTGNAREFFLANTGALYQITDKDTAKVKDIPSSETTKIFKRVREVCAKYETFQKQGNMSYFIRYSPAGKTDKAFLWGQPKYEPPEKIKNTYNQLQSLTGK